MVGVDMLNPPPPPRQSQCHEGANVAAGVETGVDSEKTITPACPVREGSTFERQRSAGRHKRDNNSLEGLLASFHVWSSSSLAREAGGSARVCVGQGGRACDRLKGVTVDLVGKATTATNLTMKTTIRPKGRQI
jgi:hypothetical protein